MVVYLFSKRAYLQGFKKNIGLEVSRAFQYVLKDSRIYEKLQTDASKELLNKTFMALMKKDSIVRFATASNLKMLKVDKFSRTLKTRMWISFKANNNCRYINVLWELVKSYNHRFPTSIKMKPMQVSSENASQVF